MKSNYNEINFSSQASCTLDASVKIYSNRVDDTYASSHRILESLSRNGTSNEEDAGEQKGPKAKAKVGSKVSSARLNVGETIETNLNNINAATLENDYSVDPIFHKMSKAFDEGGAKGMLMYHLVSITTNVNI